MVHFLHKYRSELLMCALIAQILASPLADSNPHIGGILAAMVLLLILAGSTYAANRKPLRIVLIFLTALWVLARALETFESSHPLYAHIAPVTGFLLSCAILWTIIDRFNSMPNITTNVISEAFISYLVVAIAFSQIYMILNRLLDHPFTVAIPPSKLSTLLYFSMVTLTNLGSNSIAPVNPYLCLVTAIGSMIGIFYVAVVVARLVSSYRSRPSKAGY
ncbi:hypothetical protein BH10ACI4_BH10ACI4_08210 [soil metagenome]